MFEILLLLFELALSGFAERSFDLLDYDAIFLFFKANYLGVRISSDSSSTFMGLIPSPNY